MRVLLLAKQDWANLGYILSQCLKSVGVGADMIVSNVHYNKYPKRGIRCASVGKIKEYAERADIIQFMHSWWINTGIDLKTKRVFVFHGGGAYREDHKKLNKFFNPIVEKSIIQTGDLFNLGASNEVWLLPAVNVAELQPVYEVKNNKIVLGHFPSGPGVKNSEGINTVIKRLKLDLGDKFEYIFSADPVPWVKQIKRVAKCDIYIEACNLTLKSKKPNEVRRYGEWGVAAVEAAALGKIVISHFLSYERYKQEYGECGVIVANSLDKVELHLRQLLSFSNEQLFALKKSTRLWAERYHSYQAVGKRLKEIVYEI